MGFPLEFEHFHEPYVQDGGHGKMGFSHGGKLVVNPIGVWLVCLDRLDPDLDSPKTRRFFHGDFIDRYEWLMFNCHV